MKTLSLMENDWRDCANSEISMRETMCKARLSDRITNAMIILHTMSAITYGIRVFLADVDIADSTSETPYVHKVEFPFDINTKRTYRMVLATQLVYVVMCSWAAGVVNAMLLTLVRDASIRTLVSRIILIILMIQRQTARARARVHIIIK